MIRHEIKFGNRKASIVITESDLWMSQKSIADLFDTTRQNISLHIANIGEYFNISNCTKAISTIQNEGTRDVSREIQHYNFEVIHAVGIRSNRFDEINTLVDIASHSNILKASYRIIPVKERDFGELLSSILRGITRIIPQYKIMEYFVDFYIPEYDLAVEYDEKHHNKPSNVLNDAERQSKIENEMDIEFIRIHEGMELTGLNKVMKHIIGFNRHKKHKASRKIR